MVAKSEELKKQLVEDAELRFFDTFGNVISAVSVYQSLYVKSHDLGELNAINELKKKFYDKVEHFWDAG